MAWQVNLAGSVSDLERLCRVLEGDLISVSHADDGYVLKSCLFDGLIDAGEVLATGKRLVGYVRGVSKLNNTLADRIEAAHVTHVRDDGGRCHYVFASDRIALRDRVQVVLRSNDGTVQSDPRDDLLPNAIGLAQRNDSVARVLRLLDRGQQDWANLYRIVEVIEENVGGTQAIADKGWVSKAVLTKFRHTANSRGAVGDEARHGKEIASPPSNPMSLPDAGTLVYSIVRSWLRAGL